MRINADDLPDSVRDDLARRLLFHATNAYRGASPENSSPLYEQLALGVASDPEVLRLLVGLDPQQQFANLLLGAVHFLLLGGIDHPLRDFYRSLTPMPRPPQEAYPYFHVFCLEHREQIRQVVSTHSVQTNEAGRCASLLPAFGLIAAQRTASRWHWSSSVREPASICSGMPMAMTTVQRGALVIRARPSKSPARHAAMTCRRCRLACPPYGTA